MKAKKINLRELEAKAPKNWVPKAGDFYAWRETCTRKGNLIWGTIISFDAEKGLIRGRYPDGPSERRHVSDVFKLEESPRVIHG